ncbi:MAG: hypothetical protein Fur0025_01990 [Oscillatoriaceae cyanobacterium]
MLYSNLEKIIVTGVTLYLLLATSGFASQKMESDASALAAPGAAATDCPTTVPGDGKQHSN